MESRSLLVVLLAVLFAYCAVALPSQHANNGRAGDPENSESSTPQSSGQRGPQQARLWLAGAEEPIVPTEISADLGGCSALITVTGSDAKPVFNAKVSTRIRYGLFAAKKLDLEVYTSATGQVKIVGLPESPKRPVIFQVSKGQRSESVDFKPEADCHANFNVRLK